MKSRRHEDLKIFSKKTRKSSRRISKVLSRKDQKVLVESSAVLLRIESHQVFVQKITNTSYRRYRRHEDPKLFSKSRKSSHRISKDLRRKGSKVLVQSSAILLHIESHKAHKDHKHFVQKVGKYLYRNQRVVVQKTTRSSYRRPIVNHQKVFFSHGRREALVFPQRTSRSGLPIEEQKV